MDKEERRDYFVPEWMFEEFIVKKQNNFLVDDVYRGFKELEKTLTKEDSDTIDDYITDLIHSNVLVRHGRALYFNKDVVKDLKEEYKSTD